ncbi:hypothetical protein RFI_01453 [Reticulomyxa filosa]|uniref:CUE domain-containing protein n=1 Tax=Reticulomyxa filosa TaxID=46433 RepID=X6PBW2_RETFI|nr:hypothetical protein RFI_01453 [Reticulomyxa filosa]|eukprot:ETO35608.1 hypothetical protein RFI_01453 [Reticulomyxa filosa]
MNSTCDYYSQEHKKKLVKTFFGKFKIKKPKKGFIFIIMLEQLQQTFPKIDQEIVLYAWKKCNENVEETKAILTWLTENTTNLQQQRYLMRLFDNFGYRLEKTTILQTWTNYNQIFIDTYDELEKICATSNLNESQEENELKIGREMCLHILWNILKYPKHIKYRQIHKQALYNYLSKKCHTLCADFDQVFIGIEVDLQNIGFKKENDNWYYQYDHIQLLHLWECYRSVLNLQPMYFYVFILLLLIKQMI